MRKHWNRLVERKGEALGLNASAFTPLLCNSGLQMWEGLRVLSWPAPSETWASEQAFDLDRFQLKGLPSADVAATSHASWELSSTWDWGITSPSSSYYLWTETAAKLNSSPLRLQDQRWFFSRMSEVINCQTSHRFSPFLLWSPPSEAFGYFGLRSAHRISSVRLLEAGTGGATCEGWQILDSASTGLQYACFMTSCDISWYRMTSDDVLWHLRTSCDILWHLITSYTWYHLIMTHDESCWLMMTHGSHRRTSKLLWLATSRICHNEGSVIGHENVLSYS